MARSKKMTTKTLKRGYSGRVRPPTTVCECGIILKDHSYCQACGGRVCSHFTYDTLIEYRGIKVCPYDYALWKKLEKRSGGEITAREFMRHGGR